MVSTQLQTTTATTSRATANPLGATALEGYEDLGAGDFLVPAWAVVQPTSKREGAGKHGGDFVRNVDGAFRAHLDCVILKASPNNTLWKSADAKAPECSSSDGVRGSAYGECARCAFNRFANPELDEQLQAGENVKSCNTGGYQYVIVTRDDAQLALLRFHGKSIKPSKLLNVQMRMKKLPFFGAPITITTAEETNTKGRFFVPRYAIGEPFTAEEMAPYREQYLAIRGVTLKDVETEDYETPAEDADAVTDESSF